MCQRRGALRRTACRRHIAREAVDTPLLQTAIEELEAAGDTRQQVVEIVGDTARKLSYGLHLLRLSQQRLGLRSSRLGFEYAVLQRLIELMILRGRSLGRGARGEQFLLITASIGGVEYRHPDMAKRSRLIVPRNEVDERRQSLVVTHHEVERDLVDEPLNTQQRQEVSLVVDPSCDH